MEVTYLNTNYINLIKGWYVWKIPLIKLLRTYLNGRATKSSAILAKTMNESRPPNILDTFPSQYLKLEQLIKNIKEEEIIIQQIYKLITEFDNNAIHHKLFYDEKSISKKSFYELMEFIRFSCLPCKELIQRILGQKIVDQLITSIVLGDEDLICKYLDNKASNRIKAYRFSLKKADSPNYKFAIKETLLRFFLLKQILIIPDIYRPLICEELF